MPEFQKNKIVILLIGLYQTGDTKLKRQNRLLYRLRRRTKSRAPIEQIDTDKLQDSYQSRKGLMIRSLVLEFVVLASRQRW